jgi:signal transduction histidine kinase
MPEAGKKPLNTETIHSAADDMGKITSVFLHELRNPLSLIKGTLQYIELKHPEARSYKYWDQLFELMDDMENMIFEFSQFNFCSIKRSYINLHGLIISVRDNFMPRASRQHVELTLTEEAGCIKYFNLYYCDAPKIKQVLVNIIKNAFEAVPEGGFIRINLGLKKSSDARMLSITVSNNGPAIPQDQLEQIFEPYVTYKKGGTGIGLALAKRIIGLHEGSISVRSDSETTSFEILLPLL